ncbi:hypothetical protein [Ornithinibacillus xuwenensis]|uniref:Phage protein n=1 Tax=Ornithinibacillus xuwenensis TaxID=3144668 RepID=A0ABU9XC20_9BACI
MMTMNNNISHVKLPEWIWEQARDQEHMKQLVLKYMQRYPGYTIKKVKGRFAVCEINR